MSGDLYVKHRPENNYKRWTYDNNMKILDSHSRDGETLEGFYNRINLDEKRRKIHEDTKVKNDDALQGTEQV
jgi:hypothetical protein